MPISEGFRKWLSPAGCIHGKRWKQYICHQHPTYAFYKRFVSIITSSAVPCRHHGQQNQIVLKAKCNHNLFICLHNFQPIVKCQNNLHVFWLTGSVQVFNWLCYLLPYRSVCHQLYIYHQVWKWPRNLKTEANVVEYLQEDCSANLIPSENSDLKVNATSLPPCNYRFIPRLQRGLGAEVWKQPNL